MKVKHLIFITIVVLMVVSSVTAAALSERVPIQKGDSIVSFDAGKVSFFVGNISTVESSMMIDGEKAIPEKYDSKSDKELTWSFKDAITKYDYTENRVKETITIKESHKIEFDFKISNGVLSPVGDGSWKTVLTNSICGIILERPYGIDAKGNTIKMEYKYDGKMLSLEYDDKDIEYPLEVDPTYHYVPNWVQVAAQPGSETGIYSLVQYNDGTGNALFGSTDISGTLVRYNETSGGWITVAPKLNNETSISSLVTYNDGTGDAIFGGTNPNGNLFKYNASLGHWISVAPFLGESAIQSLTKYDDGTGLAIFGGTSTGGRLYKYNTTLGGWKQVAAKYGAETFIRSLTTYNDGTGNAIYGGTFSLGNLLKYNASLNNWTQVAAKLNSETRIYSLVTYNDGTGLAIFGGTSPGGNLFKYNVSLGGWSRVANTLNSEGVIYSLTKFDDGTGTDIYGGTNPNGNLFRYNATYGRWLQVATILNSQTYILSLSPYNGKLHGGTLSGGRLFRYDAYTVPPVSSFTVNQTAGYDPVGIKFTDTSASSGTSWLWEANNIVGNNTWFSFSVLQNPEQAFTVGNWSTRLSSTNAGGSNTSTQVTFINVTTPPSTLPTAAFVGYPLNGTVPLNVSFTDQSTHVTSWYWEFDNYLANSSLQNPYHVFNTAGNYSIRLRASNANGSVWENKTNYIQVSNVTPAANCTALLGDIPLSFVAATNSSLSYSWLDPRNITSIVFNGFYLEHFDNNSGYYVANGLSQSTVYKFRIYNITGQYGELNCTTDSNPVPTPTPYIPIVNPSSESSNPLLDYWWIPVGLLVIFVLFRRN